MKTQLNTLNKVLTFHLEGMYDAEKIIQYELPELVRHMDSSDAGDIVSKYAESANDKRLKLKRIFSYLLTGPFKRSNGVAESVLAEGADLIHMTDKGDHRDLLIVSALEALSEYKVTSYNTALKIALQMGLTKVAELLEDVISWEVESAQNMSDFVSQSVIEREAPAISVSM